MHPTLAQEFVQHRQAALHQEAEQSRLAAQARPRPIGLTLRGRATAFATRLRGFVRGRVDHVGADLPTVASHGAGEMPAALASPAVHAADPVAAPSSRPASWARARAASFGPSGRTLSGPSDVTPPSPVL